VWYVIVISELGLRDLSRLLSGIEEKIGREVNPHVLREEEFRKRVRAKEHFVSRVMIREEIMRISQFVISSGYEARTLKFSKSVMAFTEYGVAMPSSVLNSPRAVQVNIQIMRTFAKLREIILQHKDLRRRLDELEKKYDAQFKVVFDAIRQLMTPPEPQPPKKRIGFMVEEPHVPYKSLKGSKER
jgi:hypothetical protein